MRGFLDGKARIDGEKLRSVPEVGARLWDWKYSESEIVPEVKNALYELTSWLEMTRLYPSPRVLGQMKAYIVARPPIVEERVMDDKDLQMRAFDEALAQYVFSKYTPDLNHEVRDAQVELKKHVKEIGFEQSLSILTEIDKRLNGFSVE